MEFRTRIFNMSGVYDEEEFSIEGASVIDCRGLEGTVCYCSPESAEEISRKIAAETSRKASATPFINWIDTGDFHYLSAILAGMQQEPFELILLDNHPDDQPSAFDDGETLSCGGWVKRLRERCPMLAADKWLGTASDIRQYPGRSESPKLPVYISLDLDILKKSEFSTDWNQGNVDSEELFSILERLLMTRKLAGIDICGGITLAKGACTCELEANRELRYCIYSKISQYLRV